MALRKSLKIEEIKAAANAVFRDSPDASAEIRRNILAFVGDLLLKHECYRGFSYLTKDESKEGNSIGIIFNGKGDGKHEFPDGSRVRLL